MPDINQPTGLTDNLQETDKKFRIHSQVYSIVTGLQIPKAVYTETFEGFCQAKLATDQWTKEQKHFMAKLFFQYSQNKRRG